MFVIIGFWPGKTLLQNLGISLAAGISTRSVTGNYLERHQQHSELSSNDIVLIQEQPLRDSGIRRPTTGGVTEEQFTKHLYIC